MTSNYNHVGRKVKRFPLNCKTLYERFCIHNYVTEFGNSFASDANFGIVPVVFCVMEGILDLYSFFFYSQLDNKRLRWSRGSLLAFGTQVRWSRGSVLAFGTQVRGFTPGRSRRIFRVKNSSAHLPSEEN